MRVILIGMLLFVLSGDARATDFTLEADWGVVVATCPDDKFAGKLRIDFTAKVEEFEADIAAGSCIAYVVVDDAVDDDDGWVYNEANFKAMAIAMDQYDADYFAITGERIQVSLEVHRSVEDGYLVYNQREGDLEEQLKFFIGERDKDAASILTLGNELTVMTGLRDASEAQVTDLVDNLNVYANDLTVMTGLRDTAVNDKGQLVIDLAAKTREADDWYNQFVAMGLLRDAAVNDKVIVTNDLAAKTREADDWYKQYTEQVAIVVVRDAKIVKLKADLNHEWDLYDELVASSQQTIDKQACKIGAWETFDSGGRTGTNKLNTDLQACAVMPGVG